MRIFRIRPAHRPSSRRSRSFFQAHRTRSRFDTLGSAILAAALAFSLFSIVPSADAGKSVSDASPAPNYNLPKSFKGDLPIRQLTEDQAALHALDRLAYGPRPGDIQRIEKMGLENWIADQLDSSDAPDPALAAQLAQFKTLRMSSEELLHKYPPVAQIAKRQGLSPAGLREQMQSEMQAKRAEMRQDGADPATIQFDTLPGPQRVEMELDLATLDRAIYDHRQLYEVMCNFWFNHFNVNAKKGPDRWLLTNYVEKTIRPNAMGKFEDLLTATAKSPAMLFYLDNWLSVDPAAFQRVQEEAAIRRARFLGFFPNATRASKGDERGLNENYGREIMELHTLGVDGGYTQKDVIAVAESLTGWTIRTPRLDPQFWFDDRLHDQSAKYVLGHKINYGGMKDGEAVLHMLATSPATAQHISFELAQYFVADNPPETLVDRMAQTFLSSDGDTRAVLHTMIYSPEFWSRQAFRAKIKTPFEVAVSAARALDLQTTTPVQLAQWVSRMGEPLYQCEPPTGYADTAVVWVNAGALLNRLNFALTLATNHIAGATVDLPTLFGPDAVSDPNLVLSRALDDFLGGQVSPQTRDTLEKQLADPQIRQARLDDPVKHVNEGLIAGLVLGAPEFQRR